MGSLGRRERRKGNEVKRSEGHNLVRNIGHQCYLERLGFGEHTQDAIKGRGVYGKSQGTARKVPDKEISYLPKEAPPHHTSHSTNII